jgi:hypothetical protein
MLVRTREWHYVKHSKGHTDATNYAFIAHKGEVKFVFVLNKVPRHKDVACLMKHHAMNTYGRMGI